MILKYNEYETELICKSSLFAGLEEEDIIKIAENVETLEFNEGDVIFSEDSLDNCLYLVVRGQIEIVRINEKHEETLITILSLNDFFGEMAFLTGEARTATARSKENSKLIKLDYDEFMMASAFSDYSKNKVILNIAKKLALRLTKVSHDYVKLLNVHNDYFNDMDSRSIFALSSKISEVRNKYLE